MSIPSRLRHFYAAQQAATPAEYERLMELHRRGIAMENTPPDRRDALEAIEARLDAAKNCIKGLACGSSCIPKTKTCRAKTTAEKSAQLTQLVNRAGNLTAKTPSTPPAETSAKAPPAAPAKKAKAQAPAPAAAAPAATAVPQKNPPLKNAELRKLKWAYVPAPTEASENINKLRGYDAKPVIVAKRSDLADNILADKNGKPIELWRGVGQGWDEEAQETVDYVKQFKEGSFFVGMGTYGNGTYAASEEGREAIAKLYADWNDDERRNSYGSNYNAAANQRLMVFGFKKDAAVVISETKEEFLAFERKTISEARAMLKAAGNKNWKVQDLGLAASIVGIDAYSVPAFRARVRKKKGEPDPADETYWVVLNRGATVVADDGEFK